MRAEDKEKKPVKDAEVVDEVVKEEATEEAEEEARKLLMRAEDRARNQLRVGMGAKVGIIWIMSREELRVERIAAELAATNPTPYQVQVWSATRGMEAFSDGTGATAVPKPDTDNMDIMTALKKAACPKDGRMVTIFRDLDAFIRENPIVTRAVKDAHQAISRTVKNHAKQIVVISENDPPQGLHGAFVINWPLPDRELMAGVFDLLAAQLPQQIKPNNGDRDEIIGAGLGLDAEQFGVALTKSFVDAGKFDAQAIAEEKRAMVRNGGLEWIESDPRGLAGVGGLDPLKHWLEKRYSGFSRQAREYGLPAPRGILTCGVPGGGKSLIAKCLGAAWKLPLLRLDVGNLFGGVLGQTESQMRRALETAEAVQPCILWVDEIEKAFASGGLDGGTSARVLGKFLTWLQDHPSGVFVVATANDIFRLPPEFLREGRWDAKWFINVPTTVERVAITDVLCRKYQHCENVDREKIAAVSEGYTGSEIEAAITESLALAFSEEQRDVQTEDVAAQLKEIVPIIRSDADRIAQLVDGLKGRARTANVPEKPEGWTAVPSIETDFTNIEGGTPSDN